MRVVRQISELFPSVNSPINLLPVSWQSLARAAATPPVLQHKNETPSATAKQQLKLSTSDSLRMAHIAVQISSVGDSGSGGGGNEGTNSNAPDLESDDGGDRAATLTCRICLENATDAVVTPCGHVFCWPCLYRWLSHGSGHSTCPLCKSYVDSSGSTVIPIYSQDHEAAARHSHHHNHGSSRRRGSQQAAAVSTPRRPAARPPPRPHSAGDVASEFVANGQNLSNVLGQMNVSLETVGYFPNIAVLQMQRLPHVPWWPTWATARGAALCGFRAEARSRISDLPPGAAPTRGVLSPERGLEHETPQNRREWLLYKKHANAVTAIAGALFMFWLLLA